MVGQKISNRTILFTYVSGEKPSGALFSMCAIINRLKEEEKCNPVVIIQLNKSSEITKYLRSQNIDVYNIPFHKWHTGKKYPLKKLRYILNRVYNSILITVHAPILKNKYGHISCIYNNGFTNSFSFYLSKKLHTKYIMHIREFGDKDFGWDYDIGDKYKSFISTYDSSNIYISISDAIKKSFSKIPQYQRIKVIYNGVPYKKRKKYIPHKTTRIVISSSLTTGKNQKDLLMATKYMVDMGYTNFKLDIYGQGDQYHQYMNFVQKNNLNKYVSFMGFSKNIDYQKYDIGVTTSICEGFGRVTAEYMMNGLAVVVSNAGANTELIDNNLTGLYYELYNYKDLANKLIMLLKSKDTIERLGKNAYRYASSHLAEERYTSNILNLLAKNGIIHK